MIVQKTSVFPAPRDVVFQKLQRLETLRAIRLLRKGRVS